MTKIGVPALLCAFVYAGLSALGTGPARGQIAVNVAIPLANTCDVQTQPAKLTMTYDPVQNTGTMGTSSFTYKCTKGAAISITPSSPNNPGGSNWEAKSGTNNFLYLLYNSAACTTNQLSNGTVESLGTAVNGTVTYSICAKPNTTSAQNIPAATYADTVTFTFNLGP